MAVSTSLSAGGSARDHLCGISSVTGVQRQPLAPRPVLQGLRAEQGSCLPKGRSKADKGAVGLFDDLINKIIILIQ